MPACKRPTCSRKSMIQTFQTFKGPSLLPSTFPICANSESAESSKSRVQSTALRHAPSVRCGGSQCCQQAKRGRSNPQRVRILRYHETTGFQRKLTRMKLTEPQTKVLSRMPNGFLQEGTTQTGFGDALRVRFSP